MIYYLCGDIMNIDITKLKSGIETSIEINEKLDIDVSNTEIIELKDTELHGTITKDSEGYYINAILSGIMTLPCSVTLKPVDIEFNTEIDGNIEDLLEEIGIFDKKNENTIDIFPIIWENILMEIPMRVVSDEIDTNSLKGDGWQVVTGEVISSPNPELEKLKDLLK